jgi:hypothetical protein
VVFSKNYNNIVAKIIQKINNIKVIPKNLESKSIPRVVIDLISVRESQKISKGFLYIDVYTSVNGGTNLALSTIGSLMNQLDFNTLDFDDGASLQLFGSSFNQINLDDAAYILRYTNSFLLTTHE